MFIFDFYIFFWYKYITLLYRNSSAFLAWSEPKIVDTGMFVNTVVSLLLINVMSPGSVGKDLMVMMMKFSGHIMSIIIGCYPN